MIDSADSNWVRVSAYVIAAGLALAAFRRERRRATAVDGVWPPFWLLTGGFLLVMAFGRAGGIGDLIADVGRDEAVSGGWYESRRPVQAAVVGIVGLGLLMSLTHVCWRTPARRRRYFPMGVAIVTLAAFAAIRIVSFHHIDSVLHGRHIVEIRVATVTELGLVVLASALTFRVPVGRPAQSGSPVPGGSNVTEF